jgi:hypothetical protein
MTSPNHSHAEKISHRLSIKNFGEEMTHPNPPHPYYQQNPKPTHPYYQ